MQPLAVDRFKCIEEAGSNLAMTRLVGRAPRGERVVAAVPQHYGPNVTVIGALACQGLEAVLTVEGATDGDGFRADVEQVLGPTVVPGEVGLMDNLRAHNVAGIQEASARCGAPGQYLPPYSPDLSPSEPCGSKVKTALRKAKARTREALDSAVAHVLTTITATEAQHWFAHCGYSVQ